jgi:hypothetical protein
MAQLLRNKCKPKTHVEKFSCCHPAQRKKEQAL